MLTQLILAGVLLQLVSCLQGRQCPHYFVPKIDLLKGKSTELMNQAVKVTWRLIRSFIFSPRSLEHL